MGSMYFVYLLSSLLVGIFLEKSFEGDKFLYIHIASFFTLLSLSILLLYAMNDNWGLVVFIGYFLVPLVVSFTSGMLFRIYRDSVKG